MAKISVIGSGSWGTALAWLLHNNGHEITLWSYLPEETEMFQNTMKIRTSFRGSFWRKMWNLPAI